MKKTQEFIVKALIGIITVMVTVILSLLTVIYSNIKEQWVINRQEHKEIKKEIIKGLDDKVSKETFKMFKDNMAERWMQQYKINSELNEQLN